MLKNQLLFYLINLKINLRKLEKKKVVFFFVVVLLVFILIK